MGCDTGGQRSVLVPQTWRIAHRSEHIDLCVSSVYLYLCEHMAHQLNRASVSSRTRPQGDALDSAATNRGVGMLSVALSYTLHDSIPHQVTGNSGIIAYLKGRDISHREPALIGLDTLICGIVGIHWVLHYCYGHRKIVQDPADSVACASVGMSVVNGYPL